jgi:putative membrane protein
VPDLPENDPRVYLAAERTLLAWIRTGLAMMGFGFVVARFGLFMGELQSSHGGPLVRSTQDSLWFGIALVLMGVLGLLAATVQHAGLVHRLREGVWSPNDKSPLGIAAAVVLAVAGIAVATYLLFVG